MWCVARCFKVLLGCFGDFAPVVCIVRASAWLLPWFCVLLGGVLWSILLASGCFQRRRGALLAQLAGTRNGLGQLGRPVALGRQCTEEEEKKEQDAAGVAEPDAHATEHAAASGCPPRPGLDQGRGPPV